MISSENSKKLLQNLIRYLKDNYNFEVELVYVDVNIDEQIAEWNRGIIRINGNHHGELGTIFILAHVFGHIVQYSEFYKKYTKIWRIVKSGNIPRTEEFKENYFLYEKEAGQLGKGLIDQVSLMDEDIIQKYLYFLDTDFSLYWNFLITGRRYTPEHFLSEWERRLSNQKMENNFQNFTGIKPPKKLSSLSNAYKNTIFVI